MMTFNFSKNTMIQVNLHKFSQPLTYNVLFLGTLETLAVTPFMKNLLKPRLDLPLRMILSF